MIERHLLAGYYLPGDVDRDKATQVHEIALDFRGRLLSDHTLQNLLLNHGNIMDDNERPESYFDLETASIYRTLVQYRLLALKGLIDLAIKPPQIVIERKAILLPGESDEIKVQTQTGLPFSFVEDIQELWIRESDTSKNIRSYKRSLESTFEEFNLQFVLTKMYGALLPVDASDRFDVPEQEIYDILNGVMKVWDSDLYTTLDRAYFGRGKELLSSTEIIAGELAQSEFGRVFLLTQEEEDKVVLDNRNLVARALGKR